MTAVLINEFVLIYTSGIADVSYYAPLVSVLLVFSYSVYSIKTPYRILIFAAGQFKQTQVGSFKEAGINIIVSLTFVNIFGLVGVALGTLVSMSYQTVYLVFYLSKNIIYRP